MQTSKIIKEQKSLFELISSFPFSKKDLDKVFALALLSKTTKEMKRIIHFIELSYLLLGINIFDLIRLQKTNILEGKLLIYQRAKSNKKIHVDLTNRAIELINELKNPDESSPYLFDILSTGMNDSDILEKMKYFQNLVESYLRKISKQLNFEKAMSVYDIRKIFMYDQI